jgi:hypothetical protein
MGTFGLFTNFSTDFSTVEIKFFTMFSLGTFRHRFGADSGTLLGSVLEPISALVLWSGIPFGIDFGFVRGTLLGACSDRNHCQHVASGLKLSGFSVDFPS